MSYTILQGGRRRRPQRLRHAVRIMLAAVAAGAGVLLALPQRGTTPHRTGALSAPSPVPVAHRHPDLYATRADAAAAVHPRLRGRLRSGLLFDVRTGAVLWARMPERRLAIASLTKMMTALVVAARARPSERVLITAQATHFSGSGVGLLPLGRRVPLNPLLYGLLLPSGNDAAIALAQHVAGSQAAFVALMNVRARTLGLTCSHFTSVSGIVDQGNYSCATDLARLAHSVLLQPWLGRIVATRQIALPFPIRGGKLYLYNNNPLLALGYPGADGVKTGYTAAAGRCLVASARRGPTWLGVVLLDSSDPPGQAMSLLDQGFAAAGRTASDRQSLLAAGAQQQRLKPLRG